MKITGLDNLQKRLQKLANDAQALDGSHAVPLEELLNESFVRKHTQYSSLSEMIEKSGFDVKSPEDFKAIPDDEWDKYIKSITSFADWKAMLGKATEIWAAKRLGLC